MNEEQLAKFTKLWAKHKSMGWLDHLELMFIRSMFDEHGKEAREITKGESL